MVSSKSLRTRLFTVVLLVNVFILIGCGGGGGGIAPVEPIPALNSITVSAANSSVALGLTTQLTAIGNYSDGSTKNLTSSVAWSTSAATVATVNPSGLVTSLTQGTAVITASSGTLTGTFTLSVGQAILQTLAVTPANNTIPLGKTLQFSATGTYSDKTTQVLTGVTWTSSANSTATIGSSGIATSQAVGTTTITATSGGVSGSTAFVVSKAALVSIDISPVSPVAPAGVAIQLGATGTFTDGSTAPLTALNWSSSDSTLASLLNASTGAVQTHHSGTVTITAASGAVSASVLLTIAPPALSGISVSPSSAAVYLGSTTTYHATGLYTDQSTQDLSGSVTWNMTIPYVAAIDGNGAVTPSREGFTEVYATLGNISSINRRLTVLSHPRYALVTSEADRTIDRATIDNSTGALRWAGSQSTGIYLSAFECITSDPDSKFVYVAHQVPGSSTTGQLEIYTLNATRGGLTQSAASPITTSAPMGCIHFEPSGRFAYATAFYNNTGNQLLTFSRDADTGLLTQLDSINLPSEPSTPTIDPSGRFLYLVTHSVTAGSQAYAYGYSIDSATGALTAVPGTPFQLSVGAASFTFHPSGRYIYLAETNGAAIDTYSLNQSTGALTFVSTVAPCINPTPVVFSPAGGYPSGPFAYSACSMSNSHGSNSGTVQAFSIGSNGSLIPIGSSPGINAPFNVVVDGEGSNLYLYGNDNYIYEYRLDKATGAISDNLRIGAHALPGSMLLLGGSGPVSYTSKFAFVSSTGDNKITSYGVAADGSFTTRQSVVAPLGPFSLSGAPWGDELIASSAAPNPALTPYAISSTGSLIAGFSFGQGVTSGGVLMAPSGNFAFDLDPTNNLLYTYVRGSNFWGTQYVLINGVPKAGVATGSLPGAITSDGVGRFLFVANKGSKSISVFGNLPEPQELTSQFTAPYPDGSPYQLTAMPLKLAVDVNGEYLYVLCDDNTVRAFSIDYYSGGHIKEVSYVTLTGTATGLTASQTGRLLYATDSLGIHGYVVSSTGVISTGVSGSSAILSNVNGVYADPSGLFLYATTSTAGAGYVYGYALDPFGVLTAIAANPIATSNQPSSVSFRTSIQ